MIFHTLNPVLFSIGPLQVRWYGLLYALGFIISYLIFHHLAKRKRLGMSDDDMGDFLLYMLIGVVAGARLFYMLFYNLPFYLANPLEIAAVWHGGLSFHGGFLGGVIAIWLFSRKKNVHFYDISDIVLIPVALALALGRIGNFINGELYGRIASVPWCIDYSQNTHLVEKVEGCRHPSQIYESLYSAGMFAVLWLLNRKNLPRGTITWLFVALYGVSRTLAEFLRQPDTQLGFLFGGLTMGQLLSIPMFLLGVYMVWRITKQKNA